MLKKIMQHAADVVELLGIEGKILLRLLARSAGLAALMLVAGLLAGIALLGLAAAAVVALAAAVGTAGALAIVSGTLLIVAGVSIMAFWSMTAHARDKAKLDIAEQRLEQQRREIIARLNEPEPPPPSIPGLPGLNIGKVDPVLVAAIIGTTAAVVGPKRVLKMATGLAGNLALISSLLSAGKSAVEQFKAHHSRLA